MTKKIVVPPVDNSETDINTFSDKLRQVLNNVEIVDNGDGTESVELNLNDRVITFIVDQSGSMTWNDGAGTRHQIARKILEDIEANYPGEIRYNLYQYGAIISNVLFFGIVEQDGFNPNDVDSLQSLYFANDNANFAGIIVVRNVERVVDGETRTYPLDATDGQVIAKGFVTKAYDDDRVEGTTYYYTVFTIDKQGKTSIGTNVKATPRNRVVPKGVTIFDSSKKIGESPTSFIGSSIQRDEDVIGLWHMDEGEGYRLFDFSDTKANLTLFDEEPSWSGEKFTPAGESAMYFNGQDDYANIEGGTDLWRDISGSQVELTVMAWVLPYKDSGQQSIVFSQKDSNVNYSLSFSDKKLVFAGHDFTGQNSRATVEDVLEINTWQHVAATYDNGNVNLYVNGNLKSDTGSPLASFIGDVGYFFSIGAARESNNPSVSQISDFFYGKITEVSVHGTTRDSDYINTQVTIEEIIDPTTGDAYIDPISGLPVTEAVGLKGDNGDRLNVFKYTIPEDADYLGGNVAIVRNEKNTPFWEGDGSIANLHTSVTGGEFFVTDADDFVLGETYYYRIYSQNALGNFSYLTDSPSLIFDIPTGVLPEYIPELTSPLEGPLEAFGVPIAVGGNGKVGLRWSNADLSDDRVKRVKVYFSDSSFPTVNPGGGSSGSLVFTGSITDKGFAHRDIRNDVERFYTITNIDKYGRNSSTQITGSAIASADATDAEEALIPLLEVEELHYEIVNNEAVSIIWKQPIANPENLETFFGETALLYASITDEFGRSIPDDSIVEMTLESQIVRESQVDDVFNSGGQVEFEDAAAYSFTTSGIRNGVIQASLSMTNNPDILSQITSSTFTVKVKSFIPSNTSNQGQTASDGQASSNSNVSVGGPIGDYLKILDDLIAEIDGIDTAASATSSSDNIFEYISQPITVSFSNPWDLEIVNRDDKVVGQRCYYYKEDETTKVPVLTQTTQALDGIYIKSSNPFVARVKVTYKGEPISSGTVDLAIWDASADLCQCASEDTSGDCKVSFTKTNVSEIITLPSYRVPIVSGTETTLNSRGEAVVTPVSYVDVALYSPDLPLNTILYAKGTFAGFSSLKELPIVFQNILRIDLNAQPPKADGVNVMEQQSTVYIINPDFPDDRSRYTYPVNQSIVEWKIDPKHAFETKDIGGGGALSSLKKVDIISRNLYSVDNVPLSNGVFSYTRTGTARNVFVGPAENREANIQETYELSATISYEGFSDQARQEIIIDHKGVELQSFGARFLMETEYGYRNAKGNRIWTDGVDYKKIFISRDPTTADYPEFLYGGLFRDCAAEEGYPVLELNPSGQSVTLSSIKDMEFIWGEGITEMVDPYTGREYLEVTDDTSIAFGEADVRLDTHIDGDAESDRTTVYFRINSFTDGSHCRRVFNPPCEDVNLDCLGLDTCDLPLGNLSISGETFIFVNGEPLKLNGGGSDATGVPPCPVCVNEPLRVSTIWTKVDDKNTKKLGIFPIETITPNSFMDIRVEVSFAGLPVPNGTPVTVVVGNNDGKTVFGASRNIVFTEIDDTNIYDEYGVLISEGDGKSYADARIIVLHVPDDTTTETVKVFSTYNEIGLTERRVGEEYNMTLVIKDVADDVDVDDPTEEEVIPPEEEASVYSITVERYDIDKNDWSYAANMQISRSAPFTGSVDNHVYVFGGFLDNEMTITPVTEVYDALSDSWFTASNMPTPRFGGQFVTIGSKIYTIGGCYYDGQNQNTEVSRAVEVYDTIADDWKTLSSMPTVGFGDNEETYGVAYGYAVHVVHNTGSDTFNYIYILSGATEVYDGNSGIDIDVLNDRFLRYCVEDDNWEISSQKLLPNDLNNYQRVTPLAFSDNGTITVFNGAFVDLKTTENEFIFATEVYNITVTDDIDLTVITIGSPQISTNPLEKYQSALVEYTPDPAFEPSSSSDTLLFITGGGNGDSSSLDLVERLDASVAPYELADSDLEGSLDHLNKARNGHGAAFAYGLDDEYGGISPYIYVFGGKTTGVEDGGVIIDYGD